MSREKIIKVNSATRILITDREYCVQTKRKKSWASLHWYYTIKGLLTFLFDKLIRDKVDFGKHELERLTDAVKDVKREILRIERELNNKTVRNK